MKRVLFLVCVSLALFASSCTKVVEENVQIPVGDSVFYASIEGSCDTKVYADEQLRVLWDADDRVSIFNKYTYNQQYRFQGRTGDNAGTFEEVPSGVFVTGNPLDNVYAVYPYKASTSIGNDGVLSLSLPAEQAYREGGTFGPGANTMVSVSSDNHLLFRNVCGYLALKLYGEGVKVSSITLKGNRGEPLAGQASVTMPSGGIPSMSFTGSTEKEITLTCATPVELGATEEDCTVFWFVVPPTAFSSGFTVTVYDDNHGVFRQKTTNSVVIERNKLSTMMPFEVVPVGLCGPFSGYYLTKGYLTKTETGLELSGNDQLEIMKYYRNEDLTSLPRHYMSFSDRPSQPVSGMFTCPTSANWRDIVDVQNLSSVNPTREGSVVNGVSGCRYAKMTVDLTGTDYAQYGFDQEQRKIVAGLLVFPDGGVIQSSDITIFNTLGDAYTNQIDYPELLRLCDDFRCAFLPCAGYYYSDSYESGWHSSIFDGCYMAATMSEFLFFEKSIIYMESLVLPPGDNPLYIPARLIWLGE